MTEKEYELFAKAWLFLVNATHANYGAVPINPKIVRVDTGEQVLPRLTNPNPVPP